MQSEANVLAADDAALMRLRNQLLVRTRDYSPSTQEWANTLIDAAFAARELDMLGFFLLRMTRSHLPDVLRVIFLYLENLGLDSKYITDEQIEAYRTVTANQYGDFSLAVRGSSAATSSEIIRLVLSSEEAASVAKAFVAERGLDSEALLTHLQCLVEGTPVLLRGAL